MNKTSIEVSWTKSVPPHRGYSRIDMSYKGDKIPKDVMTHLVMARLLNKLKKKAR